MSRKHTFLKGTFILTTAGIMSRLIGFIYRIFISNAFGSEEMGIYQLIFPVYALCYALSSSGIETAIARSISAKVACNNKEGAKKFFLSGMLLSLSISIVLVILLQHYATYISTNLLHEPRTYNLLVLVSYSFPFASIHSCIIGYYFGLKQTGIPAISQLIEQVTRVASIFLLYMFLTNSGIICDISLAVIGLVIGEICATIFSLYYATRKDHSIFPRNFSLNYFNCNIKELLPISTPLTANRVALNILYSIEGISIPIKLQAYGLTSSQALSTYGVLTGMALPCLLFPTAITSAIAAMLLPTIAEIQALNNKKEIKQVVHKTIQYCTLLGLTCLISFFIFSDFISMRLFNSPEVGSFLKVLAWLCPFLYLNTTLISIINGLGKPMVSFFINVTGLLIRIASIYIFIPNVGIYGYLSGLLISQIFITTSCIITFRKNDII